MKKQIRHIKKKSKVNKTNSLWTTKEKKVLISIGVVIFILAVGFYGFMFREEHAKANAYKSFIGKVVPDSMVCMVSGEIKHKAINPIEVNGKTYWGCCERCLSKLRGNLSNVLFVEDPVSGAIISKADAIIHLDPEYEKQAMFFESAQTYNQYIQLINNKKKEL